MVEGTVRSGDIEVDDGHMIGPSENLKCKYKCTPDNEYRFYLLLGVY